MEKQFLIVGQGIAGSLLAYNMYKAGLNFTIISSPHKSKASDIAAGMFNPLVFKRLTKSWMVDEALPVMVETYEDIESELGHKFLYPMDIIKPLASHEQKMWKERIEQAQFSDYIVGLGKDSLCKGIKDFDSYGRVTKSGYVNLERLLRKLRGFFLDKGFLIESDFEYKDLGFIDGAITWHGISAQTIVFCEGHHASENPYFKGIGFNPTKGELLEIECKGLAEDFILNKNLFVLPMGNHRFKVGATYDWKNLNEELTLDARKDLLSRLEDLIELPYTVLKHWAGIRPTVIDRRPILGTHPLHKHVAILNGLGTKGVMLAPYFAREMVRVLSVNGYTLNREVDIRRFL
ncbi:NAD(P)/FAD-dependent oxidoreductase [Marinifilum sp. RC60d5]|uniref:NAD(P)/FAD-dependent oxidoreductase n=1 Tax=Marinifilum sp. RC60d5 TaxID=3458414 RepID=UPI004036E3ED